MSDIKAKILIAEDSTITGMDLWHLLELWGYEMCEQVMSGEEAIEKAKKENPDLALIDINLKGEIGGIEAAREIRSIGIPIIFITGYSDKKTKEKARMADPAGYFIKPLDYYKLRETIELGIKD